MAVPSKSQTIKIYDGTETTVQIQDATESALTKVDTDRPWGTPTTIKKANCSVNFGDLVLCDPTGGTFTITLPPITTQDIGRRVTVKNYSISTTAIYIKGKNSEKIDGLTSVFFALPYQCRTFVARNVNEWIQVVV
jgi:hypothetical protein